MSDLTHRKARPRLRETETPVNLSPGLIGLYWLAASFAIATAWAYVVPRVKRAAHNATARCHCGTCDR
jgi:hypothetical protein